MKRMFTKTNLTILGTMLLLYGIVQILLVSGVLRTFHEVNLITICISIIMAVSLNLITGFTGQFSLGHAGFMAIGAYWSAVMTVKWGIFYPVSILCGASLAAVFGVLIGLPTLRLRGDYLAIATLGFSEVIRVVLLNTRYVGGAAGLFGIPRLINWTWGFFAAVITVVVIRNLLWSSYGRACISVREDEMAAELMGVDIAHYKVLAFTVGAFFAGLGGGVYAHFFYGLQPTTFNFMKSIEYLVMVVLGGMGSITGSILAAVVLTVINVLLQQFSEIRMILYALLLIIIMIFRPQGLMGSREAGLGALRKLFPERGHERGSAGDK
ncbi:MAG: branched-chain amino acid ABC transporter permease [Peptococcaceae bacterium]|jgi:branched-chain amino acid transport system permease protein|nr:branched-chain amino acid ABC transporter permease [Peptococcaceae bacterium]